MESVNIKKTSEVKNKDLFANIDSDEEEGYAQPQEKGGKDNLASLESITSEV
jgi:hypothetical protein